MVDISALYKESTLRICDEKYVAREAKKQRRKYLGMSEIGDECSRRLWLNLNVQRQPLSADLLRLFDLGHMIEKRIIKHFKKASFVIDSSQKEFVDFDGKFKGHCDGIISGIPESKKPHILEIKTANKKNFESIKKNGVAANEIYGPKYMAQIQCYMGYAKLERGLWIVECKDNSEQYQERVDFNRKIFDAMRAKASMILSAKFPPEGISLDTTNWKCRFCDYKENGECVKKWPGEPAF